MRFTTSSEVKELAYMLYMGGATPRGVDRWEKLVPMLIAGAELGLGPMQSVKGLTPPVNGACSLFGDIGLALIRASGELESMTESIEGEGEARKAVCTVKRRGYEARRFEYPLALAMKLKSYQFATGINPKTKQPGGGPWLDDPDNMLMWRARWRAWRTEFTDVLHGLGGAEEESEAITVEATVTQTAAPSQQAIAASPLSPPQATQTVTVADAVMMSTDAQLTELKRLRAMISDSCNGHAETVATAWTAHLQPYGVLTARDLTEAQAAELVKRVGESTDPFNYPSEKIAY